jgi:hypothetical protein
MKCKNQKKYKNTMTTTTTTITEANQLEEDEVEAEEQDMGSRDSLPLPVAGTEVTAKSAPNHACHELGASRLSAQSLPAGSDRLCLVAAST